jgi:hypothetical protein
MTRTPPFVIGLCRRDCCAPEREMELVFPKGDGPVYPRCLRCGKVGAGVPIAEAAAWARGYSGASA